MILWIFIMDNMAPASLNGRSWCLLVFNGKGWTDLFSGRRRKEKKVFDYKTGKRSAGY